MRYVTLNMDLEQLSDVKVRQAMNYAIDKDAYIQLMYSGYWKPATSVVPSIIGGYEEQEAYTYDVDKAKELGFTYEEPEMTSVPGVKELPLTLECKIVYKQAQDMNAMTEENRAKFYPQDVDSLFTGSNKDTHVAYYGEIVNAYVIE